MARGERTPPQNIEAEQSVIGCCLLGEADTLDRLQAIGFQRGDFYREAHSTIYEAMERLRERGQRIDTVLLKDELVSMGMFGEVGGASYIFSLADIEFSTVNAEEYARRVMLRSTQRELISASSSLQALAYGDVTDRESLLAEAESRILALDNRGKRESDDREGPIIEALKNLQHKDRGLLLGISSLDSILNGLLPGDLCVCGARPGVGKTALAFSASLNIARRQEAVTIFQYEMPKEECVNRFLSMISGVDGMKFARGEKCMTECEIEKVGEAAHIFASLPIYIEETEDVSIGVLASRIRRAVKRRGSRLIVVDYLEEIPSDKEYNTSEREVSVVVRKLKAVAKECRVPILCLAQLNRELEHRMDKTPHVSDLRGSGKIEAAADKIILLHELEKDIPEYDTPTEVEAIVAKARGGRKGTAILHHNKPVTTFTSGGG